MTPRISIRTAFIVLSVLLGTEAFAEGDDCPYPEFYIEFDRSYHECENMYVKKDASCSAFVERFPKLLSRYTCERSFDTGPVLALWLFGAASEDYIALLHELALGPKGKFGSDWFLKEQENAKKIMLSPEFRAVLDGSLAEDYYPKIERLANERP